MKGFFLFLLAAAMTATSLYAQGVGINAANKPADPSAMLDVSSTNQGMLVPRMTAAQRIGIASPAMGLLVFQTDVSPGFYYNAGTPTAPNWLALNVMLAGSPVGTTDVQTLTNKTLTDNSNNVLSRGLWANSGSANVSTYASPVPTAGQVLTATGTGTAAWQLPAVSYSAAINTNWWGIFGSANKYSPITDMSLTPPAGTYLAIFSASAKSNSTYDLQFFYAIFAQGSLVSNSIRGATVSEWGTALSTQAIITVDGTQPIEVQGFFNSKATDEVLLDNRSLVILKLQ